MTNMQRQVPRDGRLVSLILASKGIEDADERVIHQLLDFAHRYSADILTSAQTLSDHSGRSGPSRIEKEDVELAIQMRRRYEFFEPPPRDYLASLAHELNSQPLPMLPETFELLRLPPSHQRLGEVNFQVVPDADLTYSSDEREADSQSEEEEGQSDEETTNKRAEDEAEAEDEDMEEVGMSDPVLQQQRQVNEDYDE